MADEEQDKRTREQINRDDLMRVLREVDEQLAAVDFSERNIETVTRLRARRENVAWMLEEMKRRALARALAHEAEGLRRLTGRPKEPAATDHCYAALMWPESSRRLRQDQGKYRRELAEWEARERDGRAWAEGQVAGLMSRLGFTRDEALAFVSAEVPALAEWLNRAG